MYKVFCDSYMLYSSTIENLKIVNPKVNLTDNKSGSFSFKIYPDHPYYDMINKLTSIVTVYQDDFMLFRGRVLDEELGFRNQKSITCEGDLSFFNDSIQRPYSYTGTISGFLSQLISNHNAQVGESKQFTLGNVTVTDSNDTISRSDTDYTNTWKVIDKKLLDDLGGHIIIRHEDGKNYVDYLSDYTTTSSQTIEFAKNLLSMKRERNGEDIITALIPLGANLTDEEGEETTERLTIKSVNGGLDYIYDEDAVAEFGWIFATNIWDDVTVASNLLRKGKEYLGSLCEMQTTLELTAADLSGTGQDVSSFHIGTYIQVTSNPHGINQKFLITKLSIDLMNPASNKLTLGGVVNTLTSGIATDTVEVSGKGKDGKDGKDAAIQSDTPPSDTSQLWLDTSVHPPLLKRYDPSYEMLTSEPSDWSESYTNYYYVAEDGSYTQIEEAEETPTFEAGKYYKHVDWVTVNDTTQTIYMIEQDTSQKIDQSETHVLSTVSENYYLKNETDSLISAVSTTVTQTKDAIDIEFNKYKADLQDLADGTDANFEEIKKYIRFEDGKIYLGEVGNELELRIANDRISFYQNNAEVAYFSNNKLYVKDLELYEDGSLMMGDFAFQPRTSGNLSFSKIR